MSNFFKPGSDTEETQVDTDATESTRQGRSGRSRVASSPEQGARSKQERAQRSPKARLPPLSSPSHRRGHASSVAADAVVTSSSGMVTSGGVPESARDTIISVPGGQGSTPERAGATGIVSVPGDKVTDPLLVGPAGTALRGPPSHKPLEIIVYFMDKTGVKLVVEDGQNATAGELFEMTLEEMRFPAHARQAFSLWLVSDLLELQLKPNHIPFKLVCYWEELLEKYTTAEEQDIERDEPVIMFQRNVFFSRYEEKKLEDLDLLKLLYHEAKENIVDGRYPIPQNDCDKLAGLQALITERDFDQEVHVPKYYKNNISDYYPEHMCKRKLFGRGSKESLEERICTSHFHAYSRLGRQRLKEHELGPAYLEYLAYCQRLPYYGAAFFNGQVEHPSSKFRLRSSKDDPVYVAINTDGLFLIDMDDVEFLLGLLYRELKWEYAEPKDRENKNCLPCLFVQFESNDNGERVNKLLQVFSREAMLMDALIESCIGLRKQQNQGQLGMDDIDGDGRQDEGIIKSDAETWMKFERLCLATLDPKTESAI